MILSTFNLHLGLGLAQQLSMLNKFITRKALLGNKRKEIIISIMSARLATTQARALNEAQSQLMVSTPQSQCIL